MAQHAQYVLLTACRNEASFIPEAIRSVLSQSLPPLLWLILDDGSTDGTADLVERLAKGKEWIRVHRLERRAQRSFGGQYRAIMRGYEMVRDLGFDYLSVLDADISFEDADYFRRLLEELQQNPRLGIAGGAVCEKENGSFKERPGNAAWSVAGGVQTFRREVFEAIGGYLPLEYGASDSLAVLMAKMKGWQVRSLPALRVRHYRPSSSADGQMRGAFHRGLMEAAFGYDAAFMVAKSLRRLTFRPRVMGSLLTLAGYFSYKLKGGRPVIPSEACAYLRRTQRKRLLSAVQLKGLGEV